MNSTHSDSDSSMPEGDQLQDWYARHIVAIVFQILSLLSSSIIIVSFVVFKNRRSPFHFEILFLNIADFVWTSSHFINHVDALMHNRVTHNKMACDAMGLFTHLGIGWELCWLVAISIHSALVIRSAKLAQMWEPSRRLMIIVSVCGWGIPIIWWLVLGMPLNAYGSTGYFCWVKFEPMYISILFGDVPLFLCFLVVTASYCYLIYMLVQVILDRKLNSFSSPDAVSFKQEIRRSVGYVLVYAIWVHSYLAITIIVMVGGNIPRGFYLYFLAVTNSLGTLNFFAYGISEKWFQDVKAVIGWTVKPEPEMPSRGSDCSQFQVAV